MSVGNEPKATISCVTHLVLTSAILSRSWDLHISASAVSLRRTTKDPLSVSNWKSLVSVTTLSSERCTATRDPLTYGSPAMAVLSVAPDLMVFSTPFTVIFICAHPPGAWTAP